jgi:transcriptional regulator with XRE-family HTH domain
MRKKNSALVKVGNRIRELRKAKGFSQEAFAHEIGLDRTYMGSVERGERNIAAINLIRIAKALRVQVGELFPNIRTIIIE